MNFNFERTESKLKRFASNGKQGSNANESVDIKKISVQS